MYKAKNTKNCQWLPELRRDMRQTSLGTSEELLSWQLDFRFLAFRTFRGYICCSNPPCLWWFTPSVLSNDCLANTYNWSVFKYLHARFSLDRFPTREEHVWPCLSTPQKLEAQIRKHLPRLALKTDYNNFPVCFFLSIWCFYFTQVQNCPKNVIW